MNPPLALGSCLAVLATAACSGLGSAPSSLVTLYDDAAPDGLIEIEIDRDGAIREMEAEIPVADLPAAAREAALARLPGAAITGAERELKAEGAGFEVKLRHENRAWEVIVDERGTIVETEQEITDAEAPAAVLAAADAALRGGARKSVELIERGDVREYHVKKVLDGASYKIVLSPTGEVLRKVREHKAEIEIPLGS